jgi:hypothetical protein
MMKIQLGGLHEKTTKKEGRFRYCKNEDCDYKMTAVNPELTSQNIESPVA